MFHISTISLVTIPSLIIFVILSCSAQTFDPNVDDKKYLDTIETRLQQESMAAQHILVNQTKVLQQVTRTFIESKIKENLFKVVRERVEMELEEMAMNNTASTNESSTTSSRQARQEDEDDDEEVPKVTTPRPRPGLLPQLANVVTTLFGSDVNVTGYLKDATAFLPQDLSDRIISAASLIDPSRFTSTTVIPPPVIINGQVIPQSALVNGTFTYAQGAVPQGVQPAASGTYNYAQGALPQGTQQATLDGYQNTNVVSQQGNNNVKLGLQPVEVGQMASQVQPSFMPQSSAGQIVQPNGNSGVVDQRQQIVAPSPLMQTGTVQQQQPNQNVGTNSVQNGVHQLSPNAAGIANPNPNFKVNDILIGAPSAIPSSPTTSGEDEEEDNNNEKDSSEDELFFARDDASSSGIGYIDEYPAVKYAIRIFNHFTSRAGVPTTTEYVNTTTVEKTLDSLEEEQLRATSPATTSNYKQAVALYEGAREAYQLLQNLNKYLDRIGNRIDDLGYGPEDVGIEL